MCIFQSSGNSIDQWYNSEVNCRLQLSTMKEKHGNVRKSALILMQMGLLVNFYISFCLSILGKEMTVSSTQHWEQIDCDMGQSTRISGIHTLDNCTMCSKDHTKSKGSLSKGCNLVTTNLQQRPSTA